MKKELEIQRNYQSCQNITFDIVLEKKQEDLVNSIEKQTYSKWHILEENYKEILNSTNSDYIIFIGKNIELTSFALYDIVKTIEGHDGILYYSDSDVKIGELRQNPEFKPDFAIDTLLSKNYIGNMFAVKTKFLKTYPEILEDLSVMIYIMIYY